MDKQKINGKINKEEVMIKTLHTQLKAVIPCDGREGY